MLSRRTLVTAGGGFALAAGPELARSPARAAAVITDDGYYREDWFIDSFLDLEEDRRDAAAAGRQLAVVWEQPGCPWCRRMHLVNFTDPVIENYVRAHFDVLALNLRGSRIVTDFDGEKIGERQLAGKYGVRGTPTIQFFSDRGDFAAGLAAKPPPEREVHRVRGYAPPAQFLDLFAFVGEHAYERGSLRDFLRRQS